MKPYDPYCQVNNKCIWRQCLEPPLPHGPHKLDVSHDGYPVDFGTSVTYRCKPGYYFKHDRNEEEFQLECQDSGFFREPRPWPECIRGEQGGKLQTAAGRETSWVWHF